MLNLMGSFAEFEREIMLERQREGVAKAKADGKYKGWVPTAQRKGAEVIELRGQGVRPEEIAVKLGIRSGFGVPCSEGPAGGCAELIDPTTSSG
jgi:DNA invertase Pin-like site-specific DNA recombinase